MDRQITPARSPSSEIFKKAGSEFVNEKSSTPEDVPLVQEGVSRQISQPSAIRSHLKRVASKRVKILVRHNHSILLSEGMLHVEKSDGEAVLSLSSPLLTKNPQAEFMQAPLSYHYSFHGTYHFFSTRTRRQDDTLYLEMPAKINQPVRRKVLRVRPQGLEKPCFRCFHPLLGRKITYPVRDVSVRGLSFEADYERDHLWRGLRLRRGEILLDGQYLPVGHVTIRSLVHRVTESGESRMHCGVEFLDLSQEAERRISAYTLMMNNPQIRVPTAERIESLWRLYEKSGFTYPSKMAYIRKIKPQIDETWKKLLSHENTFYKQIVFQEGKEELGTASAVQVYENCWMLQHLASSSHPSKLIPKYLMLGLAQFLMQRRDIRYLVTYFRNENPFPRKMYSGFKEYHPFEEDLQFTKYSYLTRDLEEEGNRRVSPSSFAASTSSGIVIDSATERDREMIEKHFHKILPPLLVHSRSLTSDALHLPETSEAFRHHGLKRDRSCLVAKERGQLVAFSLLEDASQGVNLSGLLNTFSLYSVQPDRGTTVDVRRSLLEAVLDHYRSRQARVAICLTAEQDLEDYLQAGFSKEKEYICLTWSQRTIKSYYLYVQERFGRFEERRI